MSGPKKPSLNPDPKPIRDLSGKVNKLVDDYMKDYEEAQPGYSNFSRALRKSIPGKTQIKKVFLESLGEMQILCKAFQDVETEKLIERLLKAYE